VRSVHEVEFAFDGKNRRLVETFAKVSLGPGGAPHPSQGSTYVDVATPKLCFQLQRAPDAAAYTTSFMGSGDATYENIRQRIDVHLQALNGVSRIANLVPVAMFIRHPTFEAKKISAVDIGGVAAVRVEYELRPTEDKDDPLAKSMKGCAPGEPWSGWFIVCPDRSWALHEYEYHYRQRGPGKRFTEKGIVRYYEGTKDGIPLIKHAENCTTVEGIPMQRIDQVDLSEIELRPSPASDFTPEAFGLKGGGGALGPAVKPFVWLLPLAAVSLLAALGFRHLSRRKAVAS